MNNTLQEQLVDFIKKFKIQANKKLPNERELSERLRTTRGKIVVRAVKAQTLTEATKLGTQ